MLEIYLIEYDEYKDTEEYKKNPLDFIDWLIEKRQFYLYGKYL